MGLGIILAQRAAAAFQGTGGAGVIKRSIFGAGVGGAIGGIGAAIGSGENVNLNATSIAKGAITGGILGGVGLGAGKNILGSAWSAAKAGMRSLPAGARRAWGAGKGIGRAGLSVGRFMKDHPFLVAGAVGGVIGTGAAITGEWGGPVQYSQQQAMFNPSELGYVAPQGDFGTPQAMLNRYNRAFQASATGLTQRLHAGRHG